MLNLELIDDTGNLSDEKGVLGAALISSNSNSSSESSTEGSGSDIVLALLCAVGVTIKSCGVVLAPMLLDGSDREAFIAS